MCILSITLILSNPPKSAAEIVAYWQIAGNRQKLLKHPLIHSAVLLYYNFRCCELEI